VVDPERPEPVPPGAPLRARGVSVRYGPEAPWALRDVDLELRPGRRVAIVGPSGAGKSTLAAALVRFVDVDDGRITLGDVDLRAMTQASLRATVCLVAQDAHVFAGSLRANLLLARPGATQAELDGAARRAELLSWIESLPEGWDTPAGELGARISGGQRRRLALARGYLAAAPIVVLDEPGAHLDEPTADAITRHLLGAGGPRTLLLVTHRLPGLERADEVLVLEAGRITERGAPLDLLARPSRFRRLWELQAAAGSAAGATGGAR
ncbi:MAG: ABC transporter ATP-binding protein, partial [Candidatus Dormiibacterota bacterium]